MQDLGRCSHSWACFVELEQQSPAAFRSQLNQVLVCFSALNFDHFFDRFLVPFWAPFGLHFGALGRPSWPKLGSKRLSGHDFSKKVIFHEILRFPMNFQLFGPEAELKRAEDRPKRAPRGS